MKKLLNPWLNAIDGAFGIYAWHTAKGEIFSHNANEFFYLASTYKVPIAVQCLRLVDAGRISLDQWVEITEDDLPLSSPILDHRHFSYPGVKLNVKNLLRLMVEYSDNTASDLILRLSGGAGAVKKFLNEYGFSKIHVDLSTKESFLSGDKETLHDTSTPHEMGNFLIKLFDKEFLSPASTQFLQECMQRCKTGSGRIRALLPDNTVVANKTGTITGYTHDIGMIDLPDNQKLILAIYIKESTATTKEAESVIANIAKIIFESETRLINMK